MAAAPALSLPEADFRKLISRADLVYNKPASRSEEGIPIGNGRMGTLVWTTPSELRFQINRTDVYASNCSSNSFNERHKDYCGGCGFVEIVYGEDLFPESGFPQRLSVYDGLLNVNGNRMVAWPAQDVIAIELDARPDPVSVSLRMLRLAAMQTRSHTAVSQLLIRGGRIALTQEFREGDYYCKSAVAIGVAGRGAKPLIANETEVRLTAAHGAGALGVLIASAASFDPREDVVAAAFSQLETAASKGFAAIAKETADWWHAFWPRSFVHLSSADGTAELIEQHYIYFQYLMGSTSRGKFPPKFNGMLWNTAGDQRQWGAQHWYANLSCYYEAIPATNRYELMNPVFDMYSGAYEACATAARQQWSSQGIYIAETMYFDGLERLPDDIAAEMRELYLLRKQWEQRSQRFMEYSQTKHPHSSRWNWIAKGEWVAGRYVETERGFGPYGNVSHILATSAKIPYLYWRRYEYTLDREWLRSRAYPMLKGAAEFYRNYPNLKKGTDGKYHIHHVNSNEGVWGARDTDEDLCAMRGVLAAAIKASEILQQDAPLQTAWKELLANLAPPSTSDDPEALKPDTYKGPRVWVRGLKPAVKGTGMLPDGNSLPAWLFDLAQPDSEDANNTLTALFRGQLGSNMPVGLLSKVPMAAAAQGRSDAVKFLIPNQVRGRGANLANRMSLREGPQALDAEALGRASEALHLALMQSNPPEPAGDPVIRLFPAWPKEWDASFTLLARGAFLVTASMRNGSIDFVQLESKAGAECRLRNPWGEREVILDRDGKKSEALKGSLLQFATRKGEKIIVVA